VIPSPILFNKEFPLPFRQFSATGICRWTVALLASLLPLWAFAHGVTGEDQSFLEQNTGRNLLLFTYLGAKHMVTGYNHLLFLFGRGGLSEPHGQRQHLRDPVPHRPQREPAAGGCWGVFTSNPYAVNQIIGRLRGLKRP